MSAAGKRSAGSGSASRLSGLSGFLTRRPRLALGSWLLVFLVLAFLGRDLPDRLEAHPLYIGGTEAKQAHDITLRQFGSDESMVVALRGPRAAVGRQGRRLAGQLEGLPQTVVVSPWSTGNAIGGLHPSPEVAGIVVRVGHRRDQALSETLELVEDRVEGTVSPPVEASIAGLPKVFSSYAHASTHASNTGELIAIPVLLLVLLLVFRSVIAALIPIVAGAFVVGATQGVMRLLLGTVEIDAFALGAAGMMGLALGVDYSLLVVSRFREEREQAELPAAVRATVEKTARSVIPAASGLLLAMGIAAATLPGAVVSSSALAIMIATVLSAVSALFAAPATIMLLGANLDRWSLPKRYGAGGLAALVSTRLARRAGLVTAIVFGLLVLGALSSTLDTGVATPGLLPPGEQGRVEEEEVEQALGPGWLAPIEVVMSGSGEPMTSPQQIDSLAAFQKRLERDPGVQTVAGLGGIQRGLKPLTRFEPQLVKQQHGLTRLGAGIARMSDGATRGVAGLRDAAAGAGRLGRGVEAASDGAGLLVEGLENADTGSSRLTGALARASDGTGRLADGASSAGEGAGRLADALEEGEEKVDETRGDVSQMESAMRSGSAELAEGQAPLESAESRFELAWQALEQMTVGNTDPQYPNLQQALREGRELLSGVGVESEASSGSGVGGSIARAQRQFDLGLYLAEQIESNNEKAGEGTEELIDQARRLERGIESLSRSTSRVSSVIDELSAEGRQLTPALQRLRDGTETLGEGLGRLTSNADALAGGLGSGALASGRLAAALRKMQAGISSRPNRLRRLRERAPRLFDSGYFYLAGLDGSKPERRQLADFVIDLDQGGHTARMMVVPRHPITTAQGRETLDRVRDDARRFSGASGTEVAVGGLSASQLTINDALRNRTELARILMMLITVLVLVAVLRSLIVPVIAAFLNLLTVFASLGVVALLFNHSLLGGPGYVDAAVVPATMMVIFGLAMDYEVFIFARMREEYLRTGSPQEAVDNGIARTAPVVTGAAVIMITVFLCFSLSQFVTLRNFGIGQATAVFIDAFIIRLVIVPALMKGLGRWSWWMPTWLDRLWPGRASGPER